MQFIQPEQLSSTLMSELSRNLQCFNSAAENDGRLTDLISDKNPRDFSKDMTDAKW